MQNYGSSPSKRDEHYCWNRLPWLNWLSEQRSRSLATMADRVRVRDRCDSLQVASPIWRWFLALPSAAAAMNTLPFDQRACFIAGQAKSGTTLLRALLDSHPELLALPQDTDYFS